MNSRCATFQSIRKRKKRYRFCFDVVNTTAAECLCNIEYDKSIATVVKVTF